MSKSIFTILFTICLGYSSFCQKFGYVNSQEILLAMPQIKTADESLAAYQNELVAKGQKMVEKFEANYQGYLKKVNDGVLSQVQMQTEETALAEEQQSIQRYEVEVQDQLAQKKQELYEPILQSVRDAVNSLGKQEGFTFIFDTAQGAILFALDGEDVSGKLKAQLGI